MLPLIVIGADEPTRQACETEEANRPDLDIQFFEDAESAAYALNDGLDAAARDGRPGPYFVDFDTRRNAWQCSVAYGPKVFGKAAIGQDVKLAHTGWTLVLTWAPGDPAAPRRMVGGKPEGEDQSTIAWQAAPMLAANLVIDLAEPATDGVQFPGLVTVLKTMRERIEP